MMKFKKEWTEKELEAVIKVFSAWERKNLVITYGRRERNTEYTYGLPYTSSSDFAMISNTNVKAVLRDDPSCTFDWITLTESNEVVAVFTDENENEKLIVIGRI